MQKALKETAQGSLNPSTEETIIRATKMSVLIPVVFLVCWAPYFWREIITNNPSSPSFEYFALVFASSTTVVDFFVFSFGYERFNTGIKKLFGYNI
jgi:hypothetical protein